MGLHDTQILNVQRHFGEVSSKWGARYEREPERMSDLDLVLRRENVYRLLRPLIEASASRARLLDVGCGAGNLLDGLPTEALDISGVDIVPEMVAEAARRHPTGAFVVSDAVELPFPDASMDIVTCLGVLEYIPEPQAVLRDIWRVLAPGGHVIVSFPNRASLFRLLSFVEIRAERMMITVLHRLLRRKRKYERGPSYTHAQWSVRAAHELLTSAGFERLEMLFSTFGLWGIVGRSRAALRISRYLTRRFSSRSCISTSLACTIVASAQKPAR